MQTEALTTFMNGESSCPVPRHGESGSQLCFLTRDVRTRIEQGSLRDAESWNS